MDDNKPQTARLSKKQLEEFKANVDTKKLDSNKLLEHYTKDISGSDTPEKGIALFLPQQSEPMIISNKNIITMGRNDPVSGINPTLDLSDYHGAELGVSRFHAEISINEGRYYIKDMGSTNGTYVNGSKIAPYKLTHIRNGDQIRLGHLSILVG